MGGWGGGAQSPAGRCQENRYFSLTREPVSIPYRPERTMLPILSYAGPLETYKSNMPASWSTVLLPKPTAAKQVYKFPEFHGYQRFLTTLNSSLFWDVMQCGLVGIRRLFGGQQVKQSK
jgi:hypothetical protein